MRNIVIIGLLLVLTGILIGPRQTAQAGSLISSDLGVASPGGGGMDPAVQELLVRVQPSDLLTVVVVLRQQANLAQVSGADRAEHARSVVQTLRTTADGTQVNLRKILTNRRAAGLVSQYQPLWIINGFSVTATSAVIEELAQNPDVLQIIPDEIQIIPTDLGAPEGNIAAIQAPALWGLGFTGQGVVVANMDSGVDVSHPDLATRWRGGSNSWFDPYGQHPVTPTDFSGHGTWTMGIMVGGDAGGTTLGAAPGAQWISAKIFNDQGGSTVTAIHLAYQWLLDPDGNPNTDDAPQVVNNSWTYAYPGCYLTFEPDLQALAAAGILPVFAAGNGGPGSGTSYSPANNPSAFAVGAYDNNGVMYAFSSRGPSTCGGSSDVFPDLSAPGVDIYTTGLYGTYTVDSGTSFAAPHVAGGLALLLSAFPNLSVADQRNALIQSAVDMGVPGPDNNYGNGGVNLLAAYNWLAGTAPTATPTSFPTDTPTATQAATATQTPIASATSTATATLTPTVSSTPTVTATATRTPTASATNTWTPTATATATRTPTASPTFTRTPTVSPTATQIATATATATAMPTASPTATSTLAPTATATWTPTASATATATATRTPTASATATATLTPTASATVTATATRTPTASATATATLTPTASATVTATATRTPTASATATATWTPTASATAIATATRTPTASATATATRTPTATATFTPTATSTRTPTATATATRTPTVTPSARMHVGDLDGFSAISGSRWNANVIIQVHNASENPVSNVTVYGQWSNGASGSGSCVTGSNGTCTIVKTRNSPLRMSVTFTVTSLTHATLSYLSSANHDPDVDSTGTKIVVNQ